MRLLFTLTASCALLSSTQYALAQSTSALPVESPSVESPSALPVAPRDAPIGVAPLESGPQPVQGKWGTTLYGFVEFDAIHDSTQPGLSSINDSQGNAGLARAGTYQASNGQTLFGARNSRIGFKLEAPESNGIRASAVLEMDFLGNQPTSTASQAALITNPVFRIRHMALKLQDPIVDVLLGQYWQLFGWQSLYHPSTVELQGVPGQVYSRSPQARLSKTFKSEAVNLDIALAAARPAQRNSEIPDGMAGIKLTINDWKGVHTAGATGTAVDGLSIGVSGVVRRFVLPSFAGTEQSKRTGKGLSIDGLIPIIPGTMNHRANALTLTGSLVTGTGTSDLYTGLNGGVGFPSPANPGMVSPAPVYTADIDNGLVTYDANGSLHTIDWTSYIVGAQYYLPPSGKVFLSVNYSGMKSDNAASYANAAAQAKIFNKSYWVDANAFVDLTPAVRLGAEYAYLHQTYADGVAAKNTRVQFSGFYLF